MPELSGILHWKSYRQISLNGHFENCDTDGEGARVSPVQVSPARVSPGRVGAQKRGAGRVPRRAEGAPLTWHSLSTLWALAEHPPSTPQAALSGLPALSGARSENSSGQISRQGLRCEVSRPRDSVASSTTQISNRSL